MTREEYEARERRLTADIDDAYKALNAARDHWDRLCVERRTLRYDWRDQCRAGEQS
jgi:hypothetical protein